jgi:hypothetical protein
MTGASGQQFESDDLSGSSFQGCGPAILVYYMPALLQKAGKRDMRTALSILAEVFRRSRDLWPAQERELDHSVIVRIDALKELECDDILASGSSQAGKSWVVGRSSSTDASVRLIASTDFPNIDWRCHRVLSFGEAQKLDVARSEPVKVWGVGYERTPSSGSGATGSRWLARSRGAASGIFGLTSPFRDYSKKLSRAFKRQSAHTHKDG